MSDTDATCTNTLGSFTCSCNQGYTGDGTSCSDKDECSLDEDDCDTDATCTNTLGSFTCSCNAGYTGDGTSCIDKDECSFNEDNCDSEATCTNTLGSFTCSCNQGYTGDGMSCSDKDECSLGEDDCDTDATCTNTLGSFTCSCDQGYTGDGTSCIDECSLDEDDCDNEAATCTNTLGSFTCSCNSGYTGDGTSCESSCPEGWTLNPYRVTCLKLNPVAQTYGDSRGDCEDVEGGFLASFSDSDSFNWMRAFMYASSDFPDWSDAAPVWIGGFLPNVVDAEWQWVNGLGLIDSSLWGDDEPKADGRTVILKASGKLGSREGATNLFPSLCEINI